PAPPVFPAALANPPWAVDRRPQPGDAVHRQLDAQSQRDVNGGEEDDRPQLALTGTAETGANVTQQRGWDAARRVDDVTVENELFDPSQVAVVHQAAQLQIASNDG